MRRTLVFALLTLIVAYVAAPALAQEEGTDTTDTTVAEEGASSDYTPAVTVSEGSPPESTPPWTTRYLIPTTLVLAAVAVFVTVIQYFVRVVRNRYKVVE